jgi:hypothetical protein
MCLQRIFALGDTVDVMPRSLAVYNTSIFLVVKCVRLLEDNCTFGNAVDIMSLALVAPLKGGMRKSDSMTMLVGIWQFE